MICRTLHGTALRSENDQLSHHKKVKAQLARAEQARELKNHLSLGKLPTLFTTHPSSPGSPFFHPDGTHIFQKLQAFLRAQYPSFGIREVITPVIYKKNLWLRSGHWENYKDDMFAVTGRGAHGFDDASKEIGEDEEFGLKPMNCPGHCLMFQSKNRSYKELPIRYADFSHLHRNEISGSLSGLTRLRGFHQDDGHIFCRPSQVGQEIEATLKLVRMVYETFDLGTYRLNLSTRPTEKFIGNIEEWERAENQLRASLDKSGENYSINKGDGAFYGPKIDIILTDRNGKEHQTATIQLDFQLPLRFKLEYQSPAPEQERNGVISTDPELLAQVGMVRPVIIHRAILGSLERFMALLIERYQGHWPFWLNPCQMIVLTVGTDPEVGQFAKGVAEDLAGLTSQFTRRRLDSQTFSVDIDLTNRSLSKKILDARLKRYGIICVIGEKDVKQKLLTLNFCRKLRSKSTWDIIQDLRPGPQDFAQKREGTPFEDMLDIRLSSHECLELMQRLTDKYF